MKIDKKCNNCFYYLGDKYCAGFTTDEFKAVKNHGDCIRLLSDDLDSALSELQEKKEIIWKIKLALEGK